MTAHGPRDHGHHARPGRPYRPYRPSLSHRPNRSARTAHPDRPDRQPRPGQPAGGAVRTAGAEWTALGVSVRLAVTDPDRLAAARALLTAQLAELDAACSRFRPDSELRRLVRHDGRPTRISPLLTETLEVALRAARLTDGLVDPTVGTVMSQIGYDRDFALVARSGPAVLLRVQPVPGWRQVRLDTDRREVTVPPGVELDLGATAKAYAADRAAADIHRTLGCGVLVGLGGDLALAGPPPRGGWSVRVQETPGPTGTAPEVPGATVTVSSGGLATSSTAARRWSRGRTVLHHLVDPVTGLPAVSPWRTVSVHAATCVDANIASTAAVIRGTDAPTWLAGLGLPARMVDVDGSVWTVAGWPGEGAAA